MDNWKTIKIDAETGRIDLWLAANIDKLSRRKAIKMLESGTVLLNGHPVKKNYLLKSGDEITITTQPVADNWKVAPSNRIKLDVVLEDPGFIVVDKPAGVPSSAMGPDDTTALASALVSKYPECADVGSPGDGGLVHRLDTATSGLLIAARNQTVYDSFVQMQYSNHIEKRYTALVKGKVKAPQIISVSLGSKRKSSNKVIVKNSGSKAVTHIESATTNGEYSLVELLIYKGFRHQIRVHLLQLGNTICGDELYDGPEVDDLERLFLHASRLTFFHPVNREPVDIKCDLPFELQKVVKRITD